MTSGTGGGHGCARLLRAVCMPAIGILSLWALARPVPWVAAHERTDVEAVLDGATPPLPAGIEVMTAPSVAQELLVTNPTTIALTVLGGDGEPFLRLDAKGVQANVSSPDWLTSSDPEAASQGPPQGAAQGAGQPTAPTAEPSASPTGAAAGALPRWEVVSGDDSWAWFDSRIQPSADLPANVAGATRPTTVGRWQVPVVYGTHAGVLRGRFQYEPVLGSFRVVANTAPDGMVVSPLQGRIPGLFVAGRSGRTIVVRGLDGRPFLRLGPGGADVDPASPSWAIDRQARGLGVQVSRSGPSWVHLSDEPSVTWLDPRLGFPASPPSDLRQSGVVRRWSIPIDTDARPLALTGTIQWIPSGATRATSTAWWIVWPIAGGVALVAIPLAALLIVRRRWMGSIWAKRR